MQIVRLGDFEITVRDRYEVTRYDAVQGTRELARSLGSELENKLLPLFDWKTISASRGSYHSTMANHQFSFFLNPLAKMPPAAYLQSFYESMSKKPVADDTLCDVTCAMT